MKFLWTNFSIDQNRFIKYFIIISVAVLIIFLFSYLKFNKFPKSKKILLCEDILDFGTAFETSDVKQLFVRPPTFLVKKCVAKSKNKTKVLVVSYASPSCPYCDFASKQLQLYCKIHGYKIKIFEKSLMPNGFNPLLEKIYILQMLLSMNYKDTIFVWVDLDVIIIDSNQSFDPFISASQIGFQMIISHDLTFDEPWSLLNAGIYFVNNTFTMRLFFNNALKLAKQLTLQGSMDEKNFQNSFGSFAVANFVQKRILFVPTYFTHFKQVYCFPCTEIVLERFLLQNPFAVNFVGVKPYRRKKLISILLEKVAESKTTKRY